MVFVHGYATDWRTAVQRTAALSVALELDGAAMLFSWPSRGDVFSYVADGGELTARAVDQLTSLLRRVIHDSDADRIYLVAHSMGARFLLSALENLAVSPNKVPRVASTVFASPDVDADDFSHRVRGISALATRTTLYVSARDRALALSQIVNDFPRAGNRRSPIPGIDIIDTTKSGGDMWSIDGLIRHNDFSTGALDDLRALMWLDLLPPTRCILTRTQTGGGEVWDLGTTSSCSPDTFRRGIHAVRRLGTDAVAHLTIEERETCRISASSASCERLRGALRIAKTIQAAPRR
jgi:pimeloyl-ACP methyl ester carboxylesterase